MFTFFKPARVETNERDELIDVLGHHAGVGLWDAVLHEGDPANPLSKWWWSDEFRRLLGFEPGDETAFPNEMTSWSDRLHPEDVEGTFRAFGELLEDTSGTTQYDVTYRLCMKDGSYRWFQAVGGAVRDHNGAATRACGALIDINEQKNLSERATVLDAKAGVGLWDAVIHEGDATHPDSKWTWSDEFRRLVGFEPGDQTGFPNQMTAWSDRLHPDDAGPTFDAFAACLTDASGKTGYDQVYRLKLQDGSYRWFRAIGGVSRDPDGVPVRACGALIDIHEQRNLSERAEVLDANAGVGLWDAIIHEGDATHPDSKWTWSDEFRRLVGFEPGDQAGFPNQMTAWSDRLHPEDASPTFDAFAACLNDTTGKTGYDQLYRLKMKNGTYRWFRAIGGVTRHPDKTPARACGALIDIHEQQNLSERAALLDANAGVGLWDAVIHEGDATHPDSIWTWSDEFRRLVGFEPGDQTGFPNQMTAWSDRLHPEDVAATFEAFTACLNDATGRTGFNQNYRLKMKEGGYRWFRAIGGVTRHPNGTPARACGSLIDIDMEKQAESSAQMADKLRADQLSGIAEELNSSVASAAENATSNAQAVAASTEELTIAVSTILQHANDANAGSRAASATANETYDAISLLSEGVEKIGTIVDMINNISTQTNLLALNASVEASRAGDAGRGFAVVANEVRSLATQTGEATEQIGSQISSLQSDTKQAVEAINGIVELLGKFGEATETIASAIAEQDAATRKISDGTRGVVESIGLVSTNIKAAAQTIVKNNRPDEQPSQSAARGQAGPDLSIAS